MLRKRVSIFAVMAIFVLSLLVVGCSPKSGPADDGNQQQGPEPVVFKLGHVVQVGHSWDLTAQEFARLVNARTNGRVTIEIYPARQLGGDRDMFEAIQAGSLDMGMISAAPIENFTPVFTGLQLPWIFKDVETEREILKSDITQEMLDRLLDVGVKGLAVYDCGFRHFLNTQRPINVPEDMKGLKFRAVESPLVLNMYKFLGASPTPMAYGEIYTAVQTNVVNGLDIGYRAGYDEKFFEVAKYYSISNHFTFPVVLVMNKALFEKLTPEEREIFEDTAYELISYNFDVFIEQDEEVIADIEKMGVKINVIEDTRPFRELMQPIYDEYTAKDPLIKKFVDYVEQVSR